MDICTRGPLPKEMYPAPIESHAHLGYSISQVYNRTDLTFRRLNLKVALQLTNKVVKGRYEHILSLVSAALTYGTTFVNLVSGFLISLTPTPNYSDSVCHVDVAKGRNLTSM